jgi:diguanylate cyclase (GGDEF)-like protein
MNGNHHPVNRLRRLKWLIFSITIITITAGVVLTAYLHGAPFSYFLTWLVGIIVAIILIELAFRQINTIQSQLASASRETKLLERQQSSLLRISDKLASITDIENICQIISRELQESFGEDYLVSCLILTPDGETLEYPASWQSSKSYPAIEQAVKPEGAPQAPLIGELAKSGVLALMHQVSIPLQVGDKTIGELIIERQTAFELAEDRLSILHAVANQAALAIENSRLIEQHKSYQQETERREAELRVGERYLNLLNEITRTTMKNQDFQDMMQSLVEYLGKLLEADSVLIILWEAARKQMIPAAAYGPLRQVYRSLRFEPNDLPLVASVLNSARTLEISNTTNSPYISQRLSTQLQMMSLLAIPLVADDQKTGVVLISYKTQHTFSGREINLVEQATGQLALAIAKYRALDALHHRSQELSALQKATAALLTTLDLEVLLGQILDAAISAIPAAEKGTLHLVARDTGQLQLRAVQGYTDPRIRNFNPTDSASFTASAVRERRPLLIHDAHADPQTRYGGDIPEIRAISSMIIAPLILGGRTLGAISLDAYRRYAFTEADLQLLVSFAATATTAIHNAQLYTEVQKQAITDPLTELYNRRGFFELGRREVERANRFNRPLTAMMIDIDLFKQVNDTQGHLIGDQVLAGVASQIEHQLRQVDLPGRYGGDEFIALLPETDLFNAYQAAERLRRNIAQVVFPTENEPVRITVSIGIAGLRHASETLETLIERADQALYLAKQSGRNRTVQEGVQEET